MRRLLVVFAVCAATLAIGVGPQAERASASHIRGAVGTATYTVAGDGTSTMSVKTVLITRAGMTDRFGVSLYTLVNGSPQSFTPPSAGATCALGSGTHTVVAPVIDRNEAVQIGSINAVGYYDVTYDSTCWPAATYVFHDSDSARISGLGNTSSSSTASYDFVVQVDGQTSAGSPAFNASFLTNVPYDEATTWQTNLNGIAYDGTAVSYSLVTDTNSGELFKNGASAIPCSDLNTSTGVYRIGVELCAGADAAAKLASFRTAFSSGSGISYVLKVKAEDSQGQASSWDALLNIANPNNLAPVISPATVAPITMQGGATQTFSITASDPDNPSGNQVLDFTVTGLPSWATFTPSGNPGATPSASLVLSPPANLNATAQIIVGVFDNATFALSDSVQFDVQVGSARLPGLSTVPDPPTVDYVDQTPTGVLVNFTPPANNGGEAITNYEVSLNGGASWTVLSPTQTTSPLRLDPFLAGVAYNVALKAVNSVGASSMSNVLLVLGPTIPEAPTTPNTTTPPASPAPTLPPVDPAPISVDGTLPELPAGTSLGFENGAPIPVVVEKISTGGWQMRGDGFDLTLDVPNSDVDEATGLVTLEQNKTVAVSGSGFQPGSLVDVWVLPDGRVTSQAVTVQAAAAVYLGQVLVGPDGSFSAELPVGNEIPVGEHTLQVNGTSLDGNSRSLNLGVQILGSGIELPVTGRPSGLIAWATLVLLAGLVVALGRRLAVSEP